MEMDDIQVTTAISDPPGEAVSPELAEEVAGVPVPEEIEGETEEQTQEKAELAEAGLEADTPAAHQFAKMRRERRDAKKGAEEARLEAARWKGRAEALAEIGQKKEEEATVQPAPAATGRPKEEDYEDYSAFVEALSDWKTDLKFAQREAEQAAKDAEKAKTEAGKARDSWISQGVSKHKDFADVVTKPFDEGGPSINATMAEVINSSPISHELAYHLGKNVEESRRIAALPALSAARELGRLEAKLTVSSPSKPQILTNAPAPIRPIAGDGATAETVDLEKMSEGDYIAYQNRREFGAGKK